MRSLAVVLAGCLLVAVAAKEFVVDDLEAVVIEAEEDVRSGERRGRQVFGGFYPAPVSVPFGVAPGLRVAPGAIPAIPVVAPPPVHGSSCTTEKGRQGTCTTIKECYPLFKLKDFEPAEAVAFGSSDRCNYAGPQGMVAGVCCAEKDVVGDLLRELAAVKEEPAEEEFPFDASLNQECGKRFVNNVRIVNGQEAIEHEFPFMVGMLNNGRQFCGGSLIDENHVLTAAHCVSHMSKYDVKRMTVSLGDHRIKTPGDEQKIVRVLRVIRHKRFSSSTLHNDVAILTLNEKITPTTYIQPICLETDDNKLYVNEAVEVAGWGTLSAAGSQPNELRKVSVHVWTNSKCGRSYGSNAPGGITKGMICASDPRKDSCSGDSGGPLFKCSGTCNQLGIVSWGVGCAEAKHPGVYTRVSSYIAWIRNIVKEY